MTGWIKIYRSIKGHWLWTSEKRLKWWIDILISVNYSDNKVLIGGRLIDCRRGQSIKSLDTWAKDWNISKKAVKAFFNLLEKDSMIVIENIIISTRITVCNYDNYQDQGNGQETEGKRVGNGQETDTTSNKEEKKEKKVRNDKSINTLLSELKSSDDLYVNIAYNFWTLFKENSEKLRIVSIDLPKAKYSTWVEPVRFMLERDKRTIEEFQEIFEFLRDETPRENGFSWSANIRSTSKLREKFEIILKDARTLKIKKVSKVANVGSIYDNISKKIMEGTFI